MPPACAQFLLRIGVDAGNPADLRDLAAILRWATEERAKQAQAEIDRRADRREWRFRLFASGLGLLTAAVGSILTWMISHLPAHIP